tara:strand:+ start:993 stop:1292 length:300 start_codon:yes stop_codon:yes gene_type:complete
MGETEAVGRAGADGRGHEWALSHRRFESILRDTVCAFNHFDGVPLLVGQLGNLPLRASKDGCGFAILLDLVVSHEVDDVADTEAFFLAGTLGGAADEAA